MNQAENRRKVSSITRKLHFHQIWKNTWKFFWMDLWLFIFSVVCFLGGQEFAAVGSFSSEVSRSFLLDESRRSIIYRVAGGDGKELLAFPMAEFLLGAAGVAAGPVTCTPLITPVSRMNGRSRTGYFVAHSRGMSLVE